MEKKLRYQLLAGSHKIDKQKYVSSDPIRNIFSEFPHKVEWMKHRLKLLDKLPEVVDEEKREEVKFKKEHRGAGRYIVINESTKEPVHDGTMKKDEADEMILKMQGNPDGGSEPNPDNIETDDEDWDDE